MEAAAEPASGGPQGLKIGSRTATEVISTVKTNGPEPQPDNGHLSRARSCSQEDRTPSLMTPQVSGARNTQLQGPTVLESKVRALKEKMTAGRQGTSPCLTSHEWPSPGKPKCRGVKVSGARTPSEGTSWPDAVVIFPTQNLTDEKLDSSPSEEELIGNGGSRPPRPPASGLECWTGRNPWYPEAVWTLPDCEKGQLPGTCYLQENPIHRVILCQPGDPGPCDKTAHTPSLRKEKSESQRDSLVTEGELDCVSLTSLEDSVPRPSLPEGLWRAGELGALGTGGSALSLSDRVERNRLLLQEMLSVGAQDSTKLRIPSWTPSWDRAVTGRPAGDVSWDSGITLQDSSQDRTVGPKPEPLLSPRHEEAKHLLQHARMKARTRPLRASHDIVPTIAQGSRNSRKSRAADRTSPVACRDNLQNGGLSASFSGESGGGQWPRLGSSLSHVRFEDESAFEAESRYLERLQHRQHPGQDQGLLRSKPALSDYIHGGCQRRDTTEQVLSRLVGRLDHWALSGNEKKCRACGHCIEDQQPTPGKAPPDPREPWDGESSRRMEGVLSEPFNPQGLSSALKLLPSKQGLHVEWIRKTHIGDTSMCPEEADPDLDCTGTSDTCRIDSKVTGTIQPSRAHCPTTGSSPHPWASRPHGGPRWFWKADKEPPKSLQDPCYLPGFDPAEADKEVIEGRGYTPEGTVLPGEDDLSQPPVPEAKRASLGPQGQPSVELGNCWAHSMDTQNPGSTASAIISVMKPESSGPERQAQVMESDLFLETVSLPQSLLEPCTPHQAQQPSPSPEVWVPTPPPSRKTTSSASHRKAVLAGPRRLSHQGEPMDTPPPPSESGVPKPFEPTPPQNQLFRPQVRHLLFTRSCDKSLSWGQQEPWGAAIHKSKVEKEPGSQEPELLLETHRGGKGSPPGRDLLPGLQPSRPSMTGEGYCGLTGGPQGFLGSIAVGAIGPMGPAPSVASEEPESHQEPEGGLPRTELHSKGPVAAKVSLGVCAGPRLPSAAPSDRNKKSSSSLTSTLGLKKFFSTLSQGTRARLTKCRSYSVEQLQPPTPSLASHTSTPKVKKAPSLQSLHLVSPSHQRRKAVSFQNLQSLLSGKVDRSNLYLVGEPEHDSAASRPAKTLFQRALSVEDVGAPTLARTVGRVVQVFPDGTSQLQLQCSPEGTFGFHVASGNGHGDSGLYVQEMADANTAKLYSGLLGVGDEILEVNGAKVAGLGLAHIKELLAHTKSLSLRVLRQRPVPR